MDSFEYALGLFSILMGLAIGVMTINLHSLIREWRTVRWDARVLISAALALIVVVRMWFAVWTIRDVDMALVFPFYLSLFLELMLLFLLAAACVPEKKTRKLDLTVFYEKNRLYLWSLFAAFQTSFFLHWLYFGGIAAAPLAWAVVLGPLAAYLLLALVRQRALHYALPLALIGFELAWNWERTLGARLTG